MRIMSAAHDSHGHDDPSHHAEAFDPEPATALGEGEPRTPPWLPVLGVGALLVGAIWFLSGDSAATSKQATSATGSAAAGAPMAAKPPPPPRTATARAPSASGAPLAPPQDPAERAKLLEALKKKKLDFAAEKMKGVPKP